MQHRGVGPGEVADDPRGFPTNPWLGVLDVVDDEASVEKDQIRPLPAEGLERGHDSALVRLRNAGEPLDEGSELSAFAFDEGYEGDLLLLGGNRGSQDALTRLHDSAGPLRLGGEEVFNR